MKTDTPDRESKAPRKPRPAIADRAILPDPAPPLTMHQAARMLGLSKRTIERMIGDGRLPAIRIGGRWRVTRQIIDQVLEHGTTAGGK